MEEQEKKDLEQMKQRILEEKIRCFDLLMTFLPMSETDIKMTGYKTKSEALEKSLNISLTRIKKLTNEHVKKYPD